MFPAAPPGATVVVEPTVVVEVTRGTMVAGPLPGVTVVVMTDPPEEI